MSIYKTPSSYQSFSLNIIDHPSKHHQPSTIKNQKLIFDRNKDVSEADYNVKQIELNQKWVFWNMYLIDYVIFKWSSSWFFSIWIQFFRVIIFQMKRLKKWFLEEMESLIFFWWLFLWNHFPSFLFLIFFGCDHLHALNLKSVFN